MIEWHRPIINRLRSARRLLCRAAKWLFLRPSRPTTSASARFAPAVRPRSTKHPWVWTLRRGRPLSNHLPPVWTTHLCRVPPSVGALFMTNSFPCDPPYLVLTCRPSTSPLTSPITDPSGHRSHSGMAWAGQENDPAGPGYHRHRFPVRHPLHRGRPEHARVSWSDPMEPGGAAVRPSTGN